MNCHFQRNEEERTKTVDYAMRADFCQVFNDQVDSLYTLSLLLTADHGKAEQCFVSGLDDCLQPSPVFREWAQSWARRMVIKNAIRMISPQRSQTRVATANREPLLEANTAVAAITSLPPFDRFVYVLAVLEKYSDRQCAMLLDCTPRQVVDARTQSLQQLAGESGGQGTAVTVLTRIADELNQSYGEAS
jgi:DNA-directed RNA polymerase specialized sigma24 family protein